MTAVDFESFVDRLANASGEAILPFFRTAMEVEDKGNGDPGLRGFDPVTEADRAAETIMRRMIRDTFPRHGIVGEEFGSHAPDAEYVWVLDPIDGTRSFVSGIPLWGTLIGLTHKGVPAYGMMHQPFTRERFRGDGRVAWWQGGAPRETAQRGKPGSSERRLRTRKCNSLAEATLMTTAPAMFSPAERIKYDRIEAATRLYRYGADCYAYCMLAAGHVDLVIESGLKPYDIVALIPIIEGAGGVVTSWDGGSPAQGGAIVACGDKALHGTVLQLLGG